MIWLISVARISCKALDFIQGLVIAETGCFNSTGLSVSFSTSSTTICAFTRESLIYTQAVLFANVAFILSRSSRNYFIHSVNLHTSNVSLVHADSGISNDLSFAISNKIFILENSKVHQLSSSTPLLQLEHAITMKSYNDELYLLAASPGQIQILKSPFENPKSLIFKTSSSPLDREFYVCKNHVVVFTESNNAIHALFVNHDFTFNRYEYLFSKTSFKASCSDFGFVLTYDNRALMYNANYTKAEYFLPENASTDFKIIMLNQVSPLEFLTLESNGNSWKTGKLNKSDLIPSSPSSIPWIVILAVFFVAFVLLVAIYMRFAKGVFANDNAEKEAASTSFIQDSPEHVLIPEPDLARESRKYSRTSFQESFDFYSKMLSQISKTMPPGNKKHFKSTISLNTSNIV
jgi:hypothetical protein